MRPPRHYMKRGDSCSALWSVWERSHPNPRYHRCVVALVNRVTARRVLEAVSPKPREESPRER